MPGFEKPQPNITLPAGFVGSSAVVQIAGLGEALVFVRLRDGAGQEQIPRYGSDDPSPGAERPINFLEPVDSADAWTVVSVADRAQLLLDIGTRAADLCGFSVVP